MPPMLSPRKTSTAVWSRRPAITTTGICSARARSSPSLIEEFLGDDQPADLAGQRAHPLTEQLAGTAEVSSSE
jgi:hypothetical protein